jgi:excisionase family DNA binding protein
MTYTTTEAAAKLGIKRETVRGHIKRHNLGTKHGRDIFLSEDEVAFIRERMGLRGRPGWLKGGSDA